MAPRAGRRPPEAPRRDAAPGHRRGRAARARHLDARAAARPVRLAAAVDRRPAAVGRGGAVDLRPPRRGERRHVADTGRAAAPRPRSPPGLRAVAGEGRVRPRPRAPRPARRPRPVAPAAARGRRGPRRDHRGQGRRPVDRRHVPPVPPAPTRRPARRRPRAAPRGRARLRRAAPDGVPARGARRRVAPLPVPRHALPLGDAHEALGGVRSPAREPRPRVVGSALPPTVVTSGPPRSPRPRSTPAEASSRGRAPTRRRSRRWRGARSRPRASRRAPATDPR